MSAIEIASAIIGGLLGSALGSFLACAQSRWKWRLSLIKPNSFCDSCGLELKPHWNIPLFSWPLLRGRAGCCGKPIPGRFWASEIAWFLVGAVIGSFVYFIWISGAIILIALIISLIVEIHYRRLGSRPAEETGYRPRSSEADQ